MRENIPTLADRIAGAAEFFSVEDKARLRIPALYVMLGDDTTSSLSDAHLLEIWDQKIVIIAVMDNKTDRRGQYAQDQVHVIRNLLNKAILNYVHDPDAHSIQYLGSRFVKMDGARYFHQFEYVMKCLLDPDDGYELALDNFDKWYADWNLPESDPLDHPDAQDQLEGLYNL